MYRYFGGQSILLSGIFLGYLRIQRIFEDPEDLVDQVDYIFGNVDVDGEDLVDLVDIHIFTKCSNGVRKIFGGLRGFGGSGGRCFYADY